MVEEKQKELGLTVLSFALNSTEKLSFVSVLICPVTGQLLPHMIEWDACPLLRLLKWRVEAGSYF